MWGLYDYDGKPLNNLRDGIRYEYRRDDETHAFYTALYVPQTDQYGNKQYPFTIWPNYPNGGIESTLEMNRRLKFLVAINGCGIASPYGEGVAVSGGPLGTVLQNGVVLREYTSTDFSSVNRTLTVDANGTLSYEALSVTGAQLAAQGIVSTASGYFPIVKDYGDIDEYEPDIAEKMQDASCNTDAQRQALCQYENGDYLIITTEGREGRGGGFFTFKQVQRLCKQYGVKFAYMLDGGGSAQTVVGDKQLDHIYENTYGRVMPTYIVFNGTAQFKATNA